MRVSPLCYVSLLSALVAGCSTPATPGTPAAAPAPAARTSVDPKENSHAIAKGMTAEEVERRIGKPQEIEPVKSAPGHAEVWVYRRSAGTKTIQTAASTRQIEVPDFATNGTKMVEEPVFVTEQINFEESISLLMFDGKLVEWKKSVAGKRAFN